MAITIEIAELSDVLELALAANRAGKLQKVEALLLAVIEQMNYSPEQVASDSQTLPVVASQQSLFTGETPVNVFHDAVKDLIRGSKVGADLKSRWFMDQVNRIVQPTSKDQETEDERHTQIWRQRVSEAIRKCKDNGYICNKVTGRRTWYRVLRHP